MQIQCIKGFRDKTTAERIEDQVKRKKGEILTCDEEIAKERIDKGLAIKYIPPVEETKEIEVVEETDGVEKVKSKKKTKK